LVHFRQSRASARVRDSQRLARNCRLETTTFRKTHEAPTHDLGLGNEPFSQPGKDLVRRSSQGKLAESTGADSTDKPSIRQRLRQPIDNPFIGLRIADDKE